jgi:hypothetical protein
MADINFAAFPDESARNAAIAAAGPNDAVLSGWIPPESRTLAEARADVDAKSAIPPLQIVGKSANENATQVALWDCWKLGLGKHYTGIRQITGSCVGAGGGNALFSLACADVVKRRDPEKVHIPFWLLPYGISRMLAGMNDRGDGSLGSTFAKAIREYGHVPATEPGLPEFRDSDGLVWGEKAEYDWSQGRKAPADLLAKAKPYLVRSTAVCRSTDDVRESLRNYYAVVHASNWGGSMQCPVTDGVLLNARRGTWMHQMSCHGWMDHPRLGELFYVLNQWGLNAHGTCPTGAPKGGFWVRKNDMADIVSQGETFALSQFDGFPGLPQPLDFSAF